MATTDISLLSTFQKHIEDMRNLSLCKICIKPFYEPFILPCGHTYCYSCLASWFGGSHSRKRKKNCPDCRAEVKVQPSPNYLLRDLVHMFISRAELLPEDETVQEHQQAKEDEAVLLAADRSGEGLFKGAFLQPRHHHHIVSWGQGIMDYEDGVIRCPECHWELEDGQCLQCGFLQYEPGDSDSDSEDGSLGSQSLNTADTDFDADGDEIDHEFGGSMDLPGYYEPYEDYTTPSEGTRSDPGEYYDELHELYDLPEVDEDANSETTTTIYSRHRHSGAPSGPSRNLHRFDSELSEAESDGDAHTTTAGETSDAGTNYDEATETSEGENSYVRSRARPRRIIISDDSEEDAEQISGNEGGSEAATEVSDGQEIEEGVESSDVSRNQVVDGMSESDESDESDIRPPQPSASRRQHLRSQRARRGTQRHQPIPDHGARSSHTQGVQRRQRSNGRSRSDMPRYNDPSRRDNYHLNSHSPSDHGHLLREMVIP